MPGGSSPKRAMTTGRAGALIACGCIGVAVAVLAGGAGPTASAAPPVASSFAFAIGNRTLSGGDAAIAERYEDFDLVIVDGEDASTSQVDAIQSGGATVLAYLSVGTIESWRSWYGKLKRFRLTAWQDWRDEWFADTSKGKYRRRVVAIAGERILGKGFDGLFLDNVDMVEVRRHRSQRAGMGQLVAALDELVDGRGGYLFAQNGAAGVLRAAERETAIEELQAVADLGILTTATDYVDLGDASLAEECEAVENASAAGALPYVANIGLTVAAVEANPPACP